MLNSTIAANINGGLPPGQKISSGLHSSMLMSDIEFAVTEVKTNAPSSNEQQKFIQKIGGKGSPNMIFNGYNKGVNFLDSNRNPQAKSAQVVNGNKNGVESLDDDGPSPKVCLYHGKISSEWQQPHKIGAGLINLGNTCYMNTVLQCLTYCPPLANYLLHDSNHSAKCKIAGFCMMCELQRHMKRVIDRPGYIVKPVHIYQKLKSIAKYFQFDRQEDAHEFLRYVIDNMWKSCLTNYEGHAKLDPASKETTVINKIFGGYHRSQVTCLRCKEKNNTYDHFMDFILDVKQNVLTLEKALEKFTQPELLQNDNAYKCTNCKMKVSAQKKFSIYTPPNVATFQFKRFDYNRMCGSKITKHISYPEVLNLRPYMSNSKGNPIWYRLNAVLVHLGATCNSGHYYCFVRNSNGFWYVMDDTRVQQVSLNQVLNQVAYVLFYVRTNTSENVAAKRPAESSASTLKNNQFQKSNFAGSASCSVSPNQTTRPSLNMKSSALPAISKLTISSSTSTNVIPNVTPNSIVPKRSLQPLSQNREKVAFSFTSAKNTNKLPKTPTPNLPVKVVKNESLLAKGLMNGNLLVPYIEDSSESSEEEEEETRYESRKSTEMNKSKSDPSSNLNKTLPTGERTFCNNNNYPNVRENSEISKPCSIVDVKAKLQISSNFNRAVKYNSLASSSNAPVVLNTSSCNNATSSGSQKLHLSQSSSLTCSLRKGNFHPTLKSCNITDKNKVPSSGIGSERRAKTCSAIFNLNHMLEPGSSSSKVNATTQWNVTDANLRSPSIASGSSTNSINSTTEWNVTQHEQLNRRKADQINHSWASHAKTGKSVVKSDKENKASVDSKECKLTDNSAHADIAMNTVNTLNPSSNSYCDKEQIISDRVSVQKDEPNVSKCHADKSALNLNISKPLSNSSQFNNVPRSPIPVKAKPESPKGKNNKNQIFLAQEQSQNQPFQFRPNQSFLDSPQDTFRNSIAQRDSKAEKSPSLKRCFSDAVEDSCKERSSRFPDHRENGHGAVFKKLKTDSSVKNKDQRSAIINNNHNLSSNNSEKGSIAKLSSSKASEKDGSGLKFNGEIRTEDHNSDFPLVLSNGDSSSLPLNNQLSKSLGCSKRIPKVGNDHSLQGSQTNQKNGSRQSQKRSEGDSEQDSSSSKSSVEYEWVEKTKETIETEKTSNTVKKPGACNESNGSLPEINQEIDVVSELQKYNTHHMFGVEVGTWNNGYKRTFDNNYYDNRRYNFDGYDEDLDKGKVRKQKRQFKTKHKHFNPFQEAQNMRNKHKVPFYNKWNSGKYYSDHQKGERHYRGPYHNGYSRPHFRNMHGNKHRHFRR